MDDLPALEKDAAERIVREVDFQHRLIAGYVHERAGMMQLALYSLEEVFALLNTAFPQINLGELERWIRTVIGDTALADRVRETVALSENRHQSISRIRDLVGLRLVQCRKACALYTAF
ncbi:MAG: hypothetical protein N3B18_11350 [Desulfobacterota bacterium]|nr:hypothetical protein [Thermodesulfobacteriota bacterium]